MIMEKLNVRPSKYKHRLTYNEWTKEFRVGSGYVEPSKLYQGNPSCGIRPIGVAKYLEETPIERFIRLFFNKLTK
jgi:phage host-nuclease inhibitor protein Gam